MNRTNQNVNEMEAVKARLKNSFMRRAPINAISTDSFKTQTESELMDVQKCKRVEENLKKDVESFLIENGLNLKGKNDYIKM